MPSKRQIFLMGVVLLAVLPAVASAQATTELERISPVQNAIGSFLAVLLIGALAILLLGEDVDRLVDRIRSETVACFAWGLVVGLVFVVVAVVLAVSVVGIVVLIPLAVVFAVVAALGNAMGYLALFAGGGRSRWQALGLDAAIAGLSGLIPIVGQVLGFIVGSLGIGSLVVQWKA